MRGCRNGLVEQAQLVVGVDCAGQMRTSSRLHEEDDLHGDLCDIEPV